MAIPKLRFLILPFLLALTFNLGNLIFWPNFTSSIRLTPLDLCVVCLWFIFFLRKFFSSRPLLLDKRQLAFVIVATLSLVISAFTFPPVQVLVGGLYLLRFIVYFFIYLPFSHLLSQKQRHQSLFLCLFFLVLISLGQYLFFPDLRNLKFALWDDHYYRLIGALFDPGYTGLLLLISLIYFSLYFSKPLSLVGTFIAILLTYSRATYASLVATLASFGFLTRRYKFLLAIFVLLILSVFLLPRGGGEGVNLGRTYSISSRFGSWQHALHLFSTSPLSGVGFNMYRYAQHQAGFLNGIDWEASHAGAGVDSSLLFVLSTTGILGFTFYIFWLAKLFKSGSLFLRLVLVASLVHSLFTNSLFFTPWLFIFGLIRALDTPRNSHN